MPWIGLFGMHVDPARKRNALTKRIAARAWHEVVAVMPDHAAVNMTYFRAFGKFPNLKNPQTFTEKIAWRKLYQKNNEFPVFADKIGAKDEVAKIIGRQHIIETLWTGADPETIPFKNFEPPYVIKVNHSSGGNIFVRSKMEMNREQIIRSMRKQLRLSYGQMFREWGYRDIPRRVLVERMMEMPDNDVPEDYKFFVYDGRVHFIQVDYDRFKNHTRNFYDLEWNLLPVNVMFPSHFCPAPAPENLADMIKIAEKIGRFDFARVDLYSTPQGIMFGEVTFYPGAGLETFFPEEWDKKFGEPWNAGRATGKMRVRR